MPDLWSCRIANMYWRAAGWNKCWARAKGRSRRRFARCRTPIINTQRYGDYVKSAIIDINNIKKKLIGSPFENNQRRMDLMQRVVNMKLKIMRLSVAMKRWNSKKLSKFINFSPRHCHTKKLVDRLQESKQVVQGGSVYPQTVSKTAN
ncbi:hypothetical protein NQ317_014842 [Molorchus minor]|uniref:Uncharacterized protein n=1 Tax=Molorchus minor TaxID=1323400 RepID=A0ABQ9JSE3_9CUCU|nr:hypothetical protein NQ317_014842 [Molorchus minor]